MASDWITYTKFDVINYVTYCWMTCNFMQLPTLQFESKLQKCIRMGITILKNFIWGGISSDICSGITFYGSDRISDDIAPQMRILNTVIP